jgi:hypothetical protein
MTICWMWPDSCVRFVAAPAARRRWSYRCWLVRRSNTQHLRSAWTSPLSFGGVRSLSLPVLTASKVNARTREVISDDAGSAAIA